MVPAERSRSRTIGYQPALDGVRALAVAMVLVFHLDLGFYEGGYVGVSVFFTLSGFLITTLLLREHERTGTVSVRDFYLRRVRRLLPASLCCTALVGAAAAAGWYDRSGDLRPSLLGTLLQVQNWVALLRDESYADLFAAPSPLDHMWSLSLEEQVYWVWPVAIAAVASVAAARSARTGRTTTLVLGAAFAVSAASAPITAATLGGDAAYLATWTRVAEVLAGAALAAALAARPRVGDGIAPPPGPAHAWAVAGAVALALLLTAGAALPAGRGLAYEGGLPLVALASTLLVAALQADTPLRRPLEWGPIVAVGRVSFGVYLYHWPVFVLLDGERTGLERWPLAVVRLAATAVVATASYHLLERPIRERRRIVGARRLVGTLATCMAALVVFAALGVPAPAGSEAFEQDVAGAGTLAPADGRVPLPPLAPASVPPVTAATAAAGTPAPATTEASPGTPTGGPTTAATSASPTPSVTATTTTPAPATGVASTAISSPAPARAVRMLVVGDSTAQAVGNGLAAWAQLRPDLAEVEVMAYPGCGLLTGGERRFAGAWQEVPAGCATLFDVDVPARVAATRPDLVVVITSFWDVADRRWGDDGGAELTPLDEAYAQRLTERFAAYDEILTAAGAAGVAWVQHPVADYRWDEVDEPSDDPARYQVLAGAIRSSSAQSQDVHVIELASWLASRGLDTDRGVRPDGVHFTIEASTELASTWLGVELIAAALRSA